MPGHGAQISARAPTKGYIQTGARARSGHQSEQCLRNHYRLLLSSPPILNLKRDSSLCIRDWYSIQLVKVKNINTGIYGIVTLHEKKTNKQTDKNKTRPTKKQPRIHIYRTTINYCPIN